jgi:small-conductance mechanosensitive channel
MLDLPPSVYSHGLLFGNTLTEWLTAGAIGVAVWLALWLARKLIGSRLRGYSSSQSLTVIRLLAYLAGNTKQIFFLAVALDAAQETLTFSDRVLQVGLWAGSTVHFYLETKQAERGADRVFAGSLDIINFVARLIVWSLLALVALDNFGVNITALLAGLGVGGVAVALALQNVLGDLFASLSIALDKPFVVGDTLAIDTYIGKVEHIGIKTTRLRSENGEQIILSNADILKSRVRNNGRAAELRAVASLRVAYGTPLDKVKAIPKLLESIVAEYPHARFERCHLKTLGETALLFELTYFVRQPSVNPLLDLQQAVNFRILAEFERLGVDFAYPTQRLLLESQRTPAAGA